MTKGEKRRTQSEFLEVVIEALRKFHDLRVGGNLPQLGEMLGFEYPDGGVNIVYGWQEPDFTQELVNSHNHFVVWLNRLAAWDRIISDHDAEAASSLLFEFVELPLDYCLHYPYRYKQRLIYCATQLCYVAGFSTGRLRRDVVREDHKITIDALREVAPIWLAGEPLVAAIARLDDDEFRRATREYRRKAQHRFPPRIGVGDLAYVERTFPTEEGVSHTLGIEHPIQIGDVLPVLVNEAGRSAAAFRAYRALVDEQRRGAGAR